MKNLSFSTPVGWLTLTEEAGFITEIQFQQGGGEGSPLLKEAKKQLEEYFRGERKQFDLPLNPKGTPFQKKVWQALQQIPYGETQSYGDIAQAIGNPGAMRAVGGANGKNPIPIVIPCHRVIRSDGALGGFSSGLDKKKILLDLETQ